MQLRTFWWRLGNSICQKLKNAHSKSILICSSISIMYSKLIDGLKCGVVTNRYTVFMEKHKVSVWMYKNKKRNKQEQRKKQKVLCKVRNYKVLMLLKRNLNGRIYSYIKMRNHTHTFVFMFILCMCCVISAYVSGVTLWNFLKSSCRSYYHSLKNGKLVTC